MKNTDLDALKGQHEAICKTLTSHVQRSAPTNNKCQVNIDQVKQLDNGDHEISYTCTGVNDHESAKSSLHAGCGSAELKQTVEKCSHSPITLPKLPSLLPILKPAIAKQLPIEQSNDKKGDAKPVGNKQPEPSTRGDQQTDQNQGQGSHLVDQTAATISLHTCSSLDSKTVQGKIVMKNADLDALKGQHEAICKTLTSHVQRSAPTNNKCQVNIDQVKQLDNGDHEISYTCTGVNDHESAKSSLHAGCGSAELKQTVLKCSHSPITLPKLPSLLPILKPADTKPLPFGRPSDKKGDDKPAESKKPEEKKGDDKPAETKKPEEKKGDDKPAENKQSEQSTRGDQQTDSKQNPASPLTDDKAAAISQHTCSSLDSKTVQGKIVLKNADVSALKGQHESICQTLTSHVQRSAPSNGKCQVNINQVKELDNGDHEISYTCTGVNDHDSAKSSLHAGCESTELKQTVLKCSHTPITLPKLPSLLPILKPADTKPLPFGRPSDKKGADKPAETKKPDEKKGDDKSAETKKPEEKKGDDKPAETKKPDEKKGDETS